MLIYKNNMLFMQKYAPVLFHAINQDNPLHDAKLTEITGINNFTMEYKGKLCFANSRYHIDDELLETFDSVNKYCEVLILVGMGNGAVIDYVKKNFPNLRAFFIVEPILDVFKRFVHNYSFKDVFDGMGAITFVVNKNEENTVQLILESIGEQYAEIEVVGLASYFGLLEEWCASFKQQILKEFRGRISTLVTLDVSKYKWLRNTIHNFRTPHIQQESIADSIKGRPGVIVSAGPSLNKHFPLLDELKEKAVMIAAGSAIKILNSKGITPHFRMAIDADNDIDLYDESFYNTSKDIPLLYASQVCEEILPSYEGRKIFMMLPTDILGKYIYNQLQIPYRFVRSGASVVHSAFSFLCQAGCNPIIFIGQDMCFYENELYAKGRASNKQENYAPQSWIKQKDIYGNDVYTIRSYLQIKYDYEGLIKQYPDIRFINATEGGLGIEGVENKPLLDVMRKDIQNPLEVDILREVELIGQESLVTMDKVKEIFDGIIFEIEKIEDINKTRLELLKKLTKDREASKKVNKLWTDLTYIDIQIEKQLTEIPFYNQVLRSLITVQAIALKQKYNLKCDDKTEKVRNGEKYLYGLTAETEIFCQLVKDWIQECFQNNSIKEY